MADTIVSADVEITSTQAAALTEQSLQAMPTLSSLGDAVVMGENGQLVRLPALPSGSWYVSDPSTATGWRATTWAARNSWVKHTSTGTLTIDLVLTPAQSSSHHRVSLASGANTITLSNLVDGTTYELLIVQPSSGSAGTLTLEFADGYSAAGYFVLSTINNQRNVLSLKLDADSNTVLIWGSESR